jgi:hypothetical protein
MESRSSFNCGLSDGQVFRLTVAMNECNRDAGRGTQYILSENVVFAVNTNSHLAAFLQHFQQRKTMYYFIYEIF